MNTDYKVSGMTCDHCVHAVTEEVSALNGVDSVNVDLVPQGTSTVHITSGMALKLDDVRAAIEEAGYQLAPASSLI